MDGGSDAEHLLLEDLQESLLIRDFLVGDPPKLKLARTFDNNRVEGEDGRVWILLFLGRGYLLENLLCSLYIEGINSLMIPNLLQS